MAAPLQFLYYNFCGISANAAARGVLYQHVVSTKPTSNKKSGMAQLSTIDIIRSTTTTKVLRVGAETKHQLAHNIEPLSNHLPCQHDYHGHGFFYHTF